MINVTVNDDSQIIVTLDDGSVITTQRAIEPVLDADIDNLFNE